MSLSKEKLNQLFNEGWDAEIEDDYKKAKECFKKIIAEVDPMYAYEYVDSFNGLGTMAFEEGNLLKAKEYYKTAFDLIFNYLGKDWQKKKLKWEIIENRPFLRAIHGLCLCEWRTKNFKKAEELAELLLKICPSDNLGVRFIIDEIKQRKEWEEDEEI
jgi:tetratricopeptide (TPR) repeat protein